MKLQEFLSILSYGELSNLSLGEEGSGGIDPSEQGKVVQATNLALTQLYSRYSHKADYVKLELDSGIHKYHITPKHAVSNTDVNSLPRYIMDSAQEPFVDDVVKIIGVTTLYDPHVGIITDTLHDKEPRDLRINDRQDSNAIQLLSFNSIYVPHPITGQELTLEVQLNHPKLRIPVDMEQQIELHPVLYEALGFKVAAKIYGSMNGEENMAKSVQMNNLFETSCALVDQQDLLQETTSAEHRKLSIRGWV